MPDQPKKDNSRFREKLAMRQQVLRMIEHPVVLETHGGFGKLGAIAYADVRDGVVLEKERDKAEVLAVQRPTWRVYRGDSEAMLMAGVGSDLPINYIDLDPWGDPWPVLKAFMLSDRVRVDELHIVVNDGLRQFPMRGNGWKNTTLGPYVEQYGNVAVSHHYLAFCKRLMRDTAELGGYRVAWWRGHEVTQYLMHYAAKLVRDNA